MAVKARYKNPKEASLTNAELRKRHKKEDSDGYLFDVEYEKLKHEREEAERKYEQAREQYMRISAQLRNEMMNGTASETDMARFTAMLTEQGVQLQQKQEQMQAEVDEMSEKVADVENKMNDLRMRAFGGNTRAIDRTTADYKGFKLDSTDRRYANAKVVEMTPAEYLRRIAFDVKGQGMDELVNSASPAQVEKYMRQMLRGTRLNAPSLNYRNGSAVGTERAFAALFNGYSRIPVLVLE